jgi:hypothetical protein
MTRYCAYPLGWLIIALGAFALGWLTNRAAARRVDRLIFAIIRLLLDGNRSMTGYDIAKRIDLPYGPTQVILARLEGEQILTSEWGEKTEQGHRRRYYRLHQWTDAL